MYRYMFLVISAGAVVLAALCVAFFLFATRPNGPKTDVDTKPATVPVVEHNTDKPVLESMKGRFTYEKGNFSFKVPEGWEHVSDLTALTNAKNFTHPQFSFMKQGTACYLTYYDQEMDRDYYEQIGFGERTFAHEMQFDSQWYGPSETLPEDFSFDFNRVQHTDGEVYDVAPSYNIPTYLHSPKLVLYNADGGMVQADCAADMKQLTESWELTYKPIVLTKDSTGYLYVQNVDQNNGKKQSLLLFQNDADGLTYLVSNAPAQWGKTHNFTAQGLISGVTDHRTIASYNVFTTETKQSAPIASVGNVVDYYEYRDKAWALVSSDVCDGPRCDSALYAKSATGGFVQVYKKPFEFGASRIAGYIPEKQQLLLMGGYGDAGCSSQSYNLFDDQKKVVVSSDSLSHCEGETYTPSEEKLEAKMKALQEAAGLGKQGQLLRVSKGFLDFADVSKVREAAAGTPFVQHFSL